MRGLLKEEWDTSIDYSVHYRTLYGVSDGYFFYVEKAKHANDNLIFSVKMLSQELIEEIKKQKIIEEVDSNGVMSLNHDYLGMSDEDLFDYIKRITQLFKVENVEQCCQETGVDQEIGLYDLNTKMGIIGREVFENKKLPSKKKRSTRIINPKVFWIYCTCTVLSWQIIGLLAYPYVFGKIDLAKDYFYYSSTVYIWIGAWLGLSLSIGVGLCIEFFKSKIAKVFGSLLYSFLTLLSIHIMNGVSIHRALNITPSVKSILFDTRKIFDVFGLSKFYNLPFYGLSLAIFCLLTLLVIVVVTYFKVKIRRGIQEM